MYDYLLTNGDKLRTLSASVRIDIEDYINMREQHLVHMARWDSIKSYWVTEHGKTLWQLSENYLNDSERAIGQMESPVSLFYWVLQKKFV